MSDKTQFDKYLAIAKSDKVKFDEMRKAVEDAPDTQNGTAWRDDLLTVPEQLSPRLQWMKEHDVSTHHDDFHHDAWSAYVGNFDEIITGGGYYPGRKLRYGKTEHDAIVNLAEANGWPLWNEATLLTP